MNIDNLTKEEVKNLIDELKVFLKNFQLNIPLTGKYKVDEEIKGKMSSIQYKFHIYRGNIDINKFSMHIRFSDNNRHLVRLCINGTNHFNPDGTKVGPNHIHIYRSSDEFEWKPESKSVDTYAYDLNKKIFPFDKDSDLVDTVNDFINYINLQKV